MDIKKGLEKEQDSVSIGTILSPEAAMRLAINEAKKGAYSVSPNPPVGCVILDREWRLLSVGHHERFGGPHAEVRALQMLQAQGLQEAQGRQVQGSQIQGLNGARVFVTLEPCAHQGKTPSCAKALAQLPIQELHYGLVDPNPLVSGQGARILKDAGISVTCLQDSHPPHPLVGELEDLTEIFLKNQRSKEPFVALKIASSLDGQIALKNGESQWITGSESRLKAHELRARYDAVLVGSRTILIDDPRLNIRHPEISKSNKVVILDPKGEVWKRLPELRLRKEHRSEDLFFLVDESIRGRVQPLEGENIIYMPEFVTGGLLISFALSELYGRGISSLFIEGGAETVSRFLQSKAAHRLYVFMAPTIIGAIDGLSWTQTMECTSLRSQTRLSRVTVSQYGEDILWTGRLDL